MEKYLCKVIAHKTQMQLTGFKYVLTFYHHSLWETRNFLPNFHMMPASNARK